MAEALAVVGALAAVLQLCSCARKFARVLHQFAVDAGVAAAEIKRFAYQIRSFSNTVDTAQCTLSRYCTENPTSPIVVFMRNRNVLGDLNIEATMVEGHLLDIRDQVMGMKSRLVLWTSIKWSFKKSSVLGLFPEMENIKTSLGLLVATAHFEATIQAVRSGKHHLRDQM
jgi:hypothetical protein